MNCVQSNFAHSEFRLIGIRLGLWGKFVKGGENNVYSMSLKISVA